MSRSPSNYPPGVDGTEPQIAGWDEDEVADTALELGLPYEMDGAEQMLHMVMQTSPLTGCLLVGTTTTGRVFVGYHDPATAHTKVWSLRAQRRLKFASVYAVEGRAI